MFVFPLGLQAKTRGFPWMTVVILVVTCVYSVLKFDVLHNYVATSMNDPKATIRLQKQKALVIAHCRNFQFSAEECEFVRTVLNPSRVETERQLVVRLLDESASPMSRVQRREIASLMTKPTQLRKYFELLGGDKDESTSLKKNGPELAAFSEALREEDRATMAIARAQTVLTRGSFNLETLARSIFLHAGWMHLIGNMIFLLMFAIPLESRIGSGALAAIYFIGGVSGMTLELFMSTDATRPIVGASAAVSSVAAAFLVAFWPFAMRVFVSLFFIFNQIVYIPAWLFFAFFVVIYDVTGALDVHSDGVAHIAHLGGFGIGALLGAIAVQVRLLVRPFVFPFELKLFVDSRNEKDPRRRMAMLLEILFYNPKNTVALVEAWRVIAKSQPSGWTRLPPEARKFLNAHVVVLMNELAKFDRPALLDFFRRAKDETWPWKELLTSPSLPGLIALTHGLATRGSRDEEAIAVAEILIEAFPNNEDAQALRAVERRLAKAG